MKSLKIKEFILDILFPKFCVNCEKEGDYLCQDCFCLIEILEEQYCPFCFPPKIVFDGKTCSFCKKTKNLDGLFCATSYKNFIVRKLIHQFKYGYIKKLAKPICSLIITHLDIINKKWDFSDFMIIPAPLFKKRLKERGFNQAEEIAKELSAVLKIPVLKNALFKIKNTFPQMELKEKEREKNIKGAFLCSEPELIKDKKILLVDDVFTTGSTLEECALVLKNAGAKEVWGIVVARG